MARKPKKRKENDSEIVTAKSAAKVANITIKTKLCGIKLKRCKSPKLQASSSTKLRKCRVMLKRIRLNDYLEASVAETVRRNEPNDVREDPVNMELSMTVTDTTEKSSNQELQKLEAGNRDRKKQDTTSAETRSEPLSTARVRRNDFKSGQYRNLISTRKATIGANKASREEKKSADTEKIERKFFKTRRGDSSLSVDPPAKAPVPKLKSKLRPELDGAAKKPSSVSAGVSKKTKIRRSYVKLTRIKPNAHPTSSPSSPKSKHRPVQQATVRSPSPDIFAEEKSELNSDIFSFPSQSSMSETEDVAADIIERLKAEGRVVVSKVKRGRLEVGRKRKPKGATVKAANWQGVIRNLSTVAAPKKRKQKPKSVKVAEKYVELELPNDMNHFDDSFQQLDEFEIPVIPPKAADRPLTINGSFSALAQKTLRNQAAKADRTSTPNAPKLNPRGKIDKAKLLEMAKSFIRRTATQKTDSHSTPNRLAAPQLSSTINKTGIPAPASSPWRVDNPAASRLFYFSRGNDDLPSYSSDVLPSSQLSKPRPLSKRAASPPDSLNISNIENISPVRPIEIQNKITADNALIGMNPRRGLAERSPLKAINILNVVTLPFRAKVRPMEENDFVADKGNVQQSNIDENVSILSTYSNDTVNESVKNLTEDFFGFDEPLPEIEEAPQSVLKDCLPSKQRLRRKLNRLRQLLPPKPTRISQGTIKSIFKTNEKQTDIREMLSSTRNVQTAEEIHEEIDSFRGDSHDSIDGGQSTSRREDQDVRLFEELETTFDRSVQIKTYQRLPKRKATRKCHQFILFSSDTEDEEVVETRKKRTKVDKKHQKELKEFITDFNSMCEEVDEYELVVEKDKSLSSSG